jgi:hypothetical protein
MIMKSNEVKPDRNNPFLTEQADKLWDRLEKKGKSVSKDELMKRANKLKLKTHS